MLHVLVLLLGAVVGFVGSRKLRRPDRAAAAASVARSVGATVGRRKALTAPELQRACFSEMVRHVQVDRQGRTHAPARYVLHLHPDDLAVVDEARRWFHDGLVDALRQAAADNGWELDRTVSIDIQADPSRHPGAPAATAVPPDQPRSAAPAAAPPAGPRTGEASGRVLVLVRGDTGERIPLVGDVVTVGRSRDRTITIDDNRVSRAHARIEPGQGGWVVVDEGSSNGTRVGGEELAPNRPRTLRAGDVVGVGPVDLRITTGSGPGRQPGTRALDDGDRTRISGEVLPPRGRDGR